MTRGWGAKGTHLTFTGLLHPLMRLVGAIATANHTTLRAAMIPIAGAAVAIAIAIVATEVTAERTQDPVLEEPTWRRRVARAMPIGETMAIAKIYNIRRMIRSSEIENDDINDDYQSLV